MNANEIANFGESENPHLPDVTDDDIYYDQHDCPKNLKINLPTYPGSGKTFAAHCCADCAYFYERYARSSSIYYFV